MDNKQADITADLTDARLKKAVDDAFNKYLRISPQMASYQACRAVAALAREGWRPIPQDEGEVMSLFERRSNPCRLVVPAAEAQQPSQQLDELAVQLRELAEILTRMGFVTLTPPALIWPSRLQRAAEQLERQQAFQPVLASERPAATPAPKPGEGLPSDGGYESGSMFTGHPLRPATPPAPGEVGELVSRLRRLRSLDCARAATLLEQLSAPVPEPGQLERQQAFQPVLASERPWERQGWCDEGGRCWMGNPYGRYAASWQLCYPRLSVSLMKWSAPHWAIPIPASTNTSS
jgi:hypothetical protein